MRTGTLDAAPDEVRTLDQADQAYTFEVYRLVSGGADPAAAATEAHEITLRRATGPARSYLEGLKR